MNEQILEIAKEADPSGWYYGIDPRVMDPEMKKFAELIVRECISQIALIGISNFENEDISWTVETAITKIQEHFGVK